MFKETALSWIAELEEEGKLGPLDGERRGRLADEYALKLEEIFKEELIEPVDPFQSEAVAEEKVEVKGPVTDSILRLLLEIGFEVVPTAQAPFNAISREGNLVVLTGVGKFSQSIVKKARLMSSLSSVARTKSVVIVDGETKLECIEETALIEKRELEDIDETRDFEDLVAEKKSK